MAQTVPNEKSIFNIARQIPAFDARQEYLDQVCGNESLLQHRVQALLNAHMEEDLFLEIPLVETSHNFADAFLGIEEHLPGDEIGPYKLIQRISEGGMGAVWIADQHVPFQRRVALKLIKHGLDSHQVLARFEAERQTLSLMDHPNIARVLDAGTSSSGQPYFVLELVDGQAITEYCDGHQLSIHQRLELFLSVCQAIQHAHQKGIIHRDIKPSNVLVAEVEGRPEVKLIDFGIAKTVHRSLPAGTMLTGLGQIIGTLEYMSPEQARVNQLDIDTRSDVYSLGVLLYELLTGSTPLECKRMREAALDELLRIIREEEPLRPSTKLSSSETLHSIAANRKTEPARLTMLVRGELDWIVMKALEKDRCRRYETVSSFALDIQHYLNDQPVLACPPSASYRFRKFARHHRTLFVTTLVVTTSLVLGLIGTSWQAIRATRAEHFALANEERATANEQRALISAHQAEQATVRESQQRAAAEQARQKAIEETAIAQAISDFLQQDLLGLAGAAEQMAAEIPPDPNLRLTTLLDRALKKLETRFTGQPKIRESVQATLASAFRSVGRYSEAVQLLQEVYQETLLRLGPEHLETLHCRNELAMALVDAGQPVEAVQMHEQTLRQLLALHGSDDPMTLASMCNLAWAYRSAGQLDRAIPLLEQVLDIRKATMGSEHPDTLTSMNNLAWNYLFHSQLSAALQLFEQTLELRTRKSGPTHPDTLKTMNGLAMTYLRHGQLHQAIALLEKTVDMQKSILGPEHPNTLTSVNNLGAAYKADGQLENAIQAFEHGLRLSIATLGAAHPDTIISMNNLATIYQDAGQYQQALPMQEQALELISETFGLEHPDTFRCMNNLSRVYQDVGQLDKALPLLQKTVELCKSTLGADHFDTLTIMSNLASVYRDLGEWDAAILLHQQVLDLRATTLGSEHPDTIASMSSLASVYRDQGDNAAAVAVLRWALKTDRIRLAENSGDRILRSSILATVAYCLSKLAQWEEAETAAREVVSIRQQLMGDTWSYYNALSQLGECLLGQGMLNNAEPYLIDGYQGLKARAEQIPASYRHNRLLEANQRLVKLYEASDMPEDAARWQADLEHFQADSHNKK